MGTFAVSYSALFIDPAAAFALAALGLLAGAVILRFLKSEGDVLNARGLAAIERRGAGLGGRSVDQLHDLSDVVDRKNCETTRTPLSAPAGADRSLEVHWLVTLPF
jgi:hypothetical protein